MPNATLSNWMSLVPDSHVPGRNQPARNAHVPVLPASGRRSRPDPDRRSRRATRAGCRLIEVDCDATNGTDKAQMRCFVGSRDVGSFDVVTTAVSAFLAAHPSETVVLLARSGLKFGLLAMGPGLQQYQACRPVVGDLGHGAARLGPRKTPGHPHLRRRRLSADTRSARLGRDAVEQREDPDRGEPRLCRPGTRYQSYTSATQHVRDDRCEMAGDPGPPVAGGRLRRCEALYQRGWRRGKRRRPARTVSGGLERQRRFVRHRHSHRRRWLATPFRTS